MDQTTTEPGTQIALGRASLEGMLAGTVAATLAFLPHVRGRAVFPYDFEYYHIPLWTYIFNSIKSGVYPHYDPYLYSGIPFYDNTQSMLFYIPILIYTSAIAVFRPAFGIYAAQFINVFHFAVGFAGFYVWTRSRGSSRGLALSLALSAGFCGTWISNAQHAGVVATLAWYPWLCLSTERLIARPAPSRVVVVALVSALVLTSGFLPSVLSVFVAWAIYSLVLLQHRYQGPPDARPLLRGSLVAIGALLAAQLLNLALTAPFWLPIALHGVPKVALTIQGSSDLTSLLTAYSPGALRSFTLQRYVGVGDITSTYHFTGLAPFLALALLRHPLAALRNAAFVTAVILLLLSRNVFGEADALQRLPILGVLYRPYLFEALVVPFLVVSLARSTLEDMRQLALTALVLFAASLIAFTGYAWVVRKIDVDLVAIAAMLVIAAASLLLIRRLTAWKLAAGLFVLAVGPFLFHAVKNNQMWLSRTRPDSYSATTVERGFSDMLAKLRQGSGPYRVAVDQEMMGGPWNGAWRVWKIESINGFEPNLELVYRDYVLDGLAQWSQQRIFGRLDPASPKFDTLNVRYAVVTSENAKSFAASSEWKLVHDSYFRVFERLRATPRFRAEIEACAGPSDIVVRSRVPGYQMLAIDAKCSDTVILASERPHRNWSVIANGRPIAWEAIEPAHGIRFRLPVGPTIVELRYRTPGLIPAFGVSALAIAGGAAVLLRSRRRRTLVSAEPSSS